jgi:hypothetical protein
MQVEIAHRFLLFAFGAVLLAIAHDLAEHLAVEAGAFGFGVGFLDVVGDRFFLFCALCVSDCGATVSVPPKSGMVLNLRFENRIVEKR